MNPQFARILILAGILLLLIGVIMLAAPKIPFLGKLPGDFTFRGKNVTVYFPLMTGIVLSIVISLILNFFGKR